MEYKRHPESELFPAMTSEEFGALVESIKINGFDKSFPILTFEDQIVDGWHRYRAAAKAGVEPMFRAWRGAKANLQAFVIYANSTRRHLSKAAHAAALIRARTHGLDIPNKEIARVSGVSMSTVTEQTRLREKNPGIADEVAEGTKKATWARRKVLKAPESGSMSAVGTGLALTINTKLAKRVRAEALEQTETAERFVITACQERLERLKKKR